MDKAEGLSLWIRPGDKYKYFEGLVKRFSKDFKTKEFIPHITLLGDIKEDKDEALKKTEELCKGIRPFRISVKGTDYLDTYFRCFFARAHSEELIKMNEKARILFSRQDDPKFLPHLSLIYGDLDTKKKDALAKILNINKEIIVEKIWLYSCIGYPEEWHMIKEFKLGDRK